jgi:hypothetical protein
MLQISYTNKQLDYGIRLLEDLYMKIHFEIFNNLCKNRELKTPTEKDFILYGECFFNKISKKERDFIINCWQKFKASKDNYNYDEKFKKPLLHYKNTKKIKVKILSHKKKYVHCEVLGDHKKRTNFLRILKTKKTGHLIEDKVYSLDLCEIQSGALHESNIFELAYKIKKENI